MEHGAWEALREISQLPEITQRRPNVGTRVRVIQGRKWLGAEGTVTWHGRDQFTKAYRYGEPIMHHMTDLQGQWGFRVRVRTDDGEQFFIAAEKVCVL